MPTSLLHRIGAPNFYSNTCPVTGELAIPQALANGATWAQISRSLGVTTQAAHKRYRWLHHSHVTGEVWYEPLLPF